MELWHNNNFIGIDAYTDFEDEKRPTKQIDTSWGYYSVAYTKSKIVCKESLLFNLPS